MSTTCTYSSTNAPCCPAPATHQAQGSVYDFAWRSLLSQERTVGSGALMMRFDVPEFCVDHAGVVATLRNTPLLAGERFPRQQGEV